MPSRIQRRRTPGWRMPAGCIYVGRPHPLGNPFNVRHQAMPWVAVALGLRADLRGRQEAALRLYRNWLDGQPIEQQPPAPDGCDLIKFQGGESRTVDQHCRLLATGIVHSLYPLDAPPPPAREVIMALRGHDLACWCALDQPCHADVLLELANS